MNIVAVAGAFFQVAHDLLKMFPNYDQREKNEMEELLQRYNTAITRKDGIDHDLIMNLLDELTAKTKKFTDFMINENKNKKELVQ